MEPFKITQTIPEQHTGKAQNQGTKKQPYWALHIYEGCSKSIGP